VRDVQDLKCAFPSTRSKFIGCRGDCIIGLCEFARAHRIPIRALNAPAATIRAVSRGGGLAKLPPEQRADLPAESWTDDPVYERITNQALSAHMALDPARLRPVFEAQAARDRATGRPGPARETMTTAEVTQYAATFAAGAAGCLSMVKLMQSLERRRQVGYPAGSWFDPARKPASLRDVNPRAWM
jgi:hypothetical protein